MTPRHPRRPRQHSSNTAPGGQGGGAGGGDTARQVGPSRGIPNRAGSPAASAGRPRGPVRLSDCHYFISSFIHSSPTGIGPMTGEVNDQNRSASDQPHPLTHSLPVRKCCPPPHPQRPVSVSVSVPVSVQLTSSWPRRSLASVSDVLPNSLAGGRRAAPAAGSPYRCATYRCSSRKRRYRRYRVYLSPPAHRRTSYSKCASRPAPRRMYRGTVTAAAAGGDGAGSAPEGGERRG